MAKRSERNKIRYALWQNMKDCQKMADRVGDIAVTYINTGNDDYAAYVSQLLNPIGELAKAFERTRDEL